MSAVEQLEQQKGFVGHDQAWHAASSLARAPLGIIGPKGVGRSIFAERALGIIAPESPVIRLAPTNAAGLDELFAFHRIQVRDPAPAFIVDITDASESVQRPLLGLLENTKLKVALVSSSLSAALSSRLFRIELGFLQHDEVRELLRAHGVAKPTVERLAHLCQGSLHNWTQLQPVAVASTQLATSVTKGVAPNGFPAMFLAARVFANEVICRRPRVFSPGELARVVTSPAAVSVCKQLMHLPTPESEPHARVEVRVWWDALQAAL
jgi:hypothetical protein